MDFLADLLGVSVGNMIGNPATIVAGLIISRLSPRTGRFWLEFIVAILACLGVQLALERMEPELPSPFSTSFWLIAEAISIALWTVIFGIGRRLRSRSFARQEARHAREDNDLAQD